MKRTYFCWKGVFFVASFCLLISLSLGTLVCYGTQIQSNVVWLSEDYEVVWVRYNITHDPITLAVSLDLEIPAGASIHYLCLETKNDWAGNKIRKPDVRSLPENKSYIGITCGYKAEWYELGPSTLALDISCWYAVPIPKIMGEAYCINLGDGRWLWFEIPGLRFTDPFFLSPQGYMPVQLRISVPYDWNCGEAYR